MESLRRSAVAKSASNRFRNFASGPTRTEGDWRRRTKSETSGFFRVRQKQETSDTSDNELNAEWEEEGTEEESLMKVMENFSKQNLREGAVFSKIFKEDVEMVHLDDSYQHKVGLDVLIENSIRKKSDSQTDLMSLVCRNACTPSSSTISRRLSQSFSVDPLQGMIGSRTSRLFKTTRRTGHDWDPQRLQEVLAPRATGSKHGRTKDTI